MSTDSQKTRVNIRPTLIIGLGGTGARIAVELKARMEESFGGTGNYHRAVRFVCFDTANENFFTYQPNYPNRRVELVPEQEFIRISDVPLHDLIQSREANPAIAAVLPEILHSTHIDQGAQQVRRLGRIALIYHYNRIKEKLNRAINELRHIDVVGKLGETDTHELHVTDRARLRVFIVCSICGGTGSGTFIDMAYLVRHFAADAGITSARAVDVVGMLLLPEAFPEIVTTGYTRIRANAYAALTDLEYYNQPTTAGEALYRITLPGEEIQVDGPPFSLCYLASRAGTKGTLGGMADLAPVLADSLQSMIASRIGEQLDATLDNIRGSLSTYYNGYRAFYSSVGIGRIVYPLAWLRRQFSRRLKRDLINEYVLAEPTVDDQLRLKAEHWYGSSAQKLGSSGQRDILRRELTRNLAEENQITRRLDNLRSDVNTRDDLVSELQYAYRDALNQHQTQIVPQVRDNRSKTRDTMLDALQTHLFHLIDGDESRGGLVLAREWLEYLRGLVEEDMGELSQRQRSRDPNTALYEHITRINDGLTIPLAGTTLARSRTRKACLELAELVNRNLRDNAINEVLYDLLADLLHMIDSYEQTINRAIDQWQHAAANSEMLEVEPNYAPTTQSIIGREDIEAHLGKILDAAKKRGLVANNAAAPAQTSQIGAIHRELQTEWRKLAASIKMQVNIQDNTPGLALSLELVHHEAMIDTLERFCDEQYTSTAQTNVAQRIIESALGNEDDIVNRMGEQAQPMLVYSEGKLQAMRPREIKVLGAKSKQDAERVKTKVQSAGGDVSVVGTGEETELAFLVTHHGIPAVALNRFEDYRRHYVRLRRERTTIMHLNREREQAPYDPGSLYFVNLELFEAYLARALGHRWIVRGTGGENQQAPVFGFSENFAKAFRNVLNSTLTRMENEKQAATTARDKLGITETGTYEYVQRNEQIDYLTTQIEILQGFQANMLSSEPVMLQDTVGAPVDTFILHIPLGPIGKDSHITETWQPVLNLTDVYSALVGGDSRSRLIPGLFIEACDRMLNANTPGANGSVDNTQIRDFLRQRGYAPDQIFEDNSAIQPLQPLWSTPGKPDYMFEQRLTALLVVEYRMRANARYNYRRMPPGYYLERDGDVMMGYEEQPEQEL